MNIEILLQDIYDMDASLKEYDKELRKILADMIKIKPEIKLDENFVRTLRLQLSERASVTSHSGGWLSKLAFSLSGAVAMAILFFAVTQWPVGQPALFTSNIKTVGQTAFDFSGGSATVSAPQPTGALRTESAVGVGGGGMSVSSADAKMMVPPYPGGEPVSYNYVYKGELPALTEAQLAVYKRLPSTVNQPAFEKMLSGLNFGLVDIKSFDQLKGEYISFKEEKKYGYLIGISLSEGLVSINQNWTQWPNPFSECSDDACYQRLALKPSDVPSDEALIAMADAFLKDHAISQENYGPAQVIHSEPPVYRFAEDAPAQEMPVYVPDYMNIVYPERMDDKDVTEGDGSPSGLNISISVRDKKVVSLNNLRASEFEKSLYDTETDTASLLDWASRGGVNYWEYSAPGSEKVDIALGDPKLVYFKFYNWKDNQNEEFLIPAYAFPIEKTKDYQLYRNTIVVPLIKGFENLSPEQGTDPVPMPLMTK